MHCNKIFWLLFLPLFLKCMELEQEVPKQYFVSVGYAQNQGSRSYQEDRFDLRLEKQSDCPFDAYAAIFDGHSGAAVAEYASKNFYQYICRYPGQQNVNEEFFKQAFKQFDADLHIKTGNKFDKVGTTATAAFLKGDLLYVANVGDSEAVDNKGDQLTKAHKIPSYNPEFSNRIAKLMVYL